MKANTTDSLSSNLKNLLSAVESYSDAEVRSRAVRDLDRMIDTLSRLRDGLQEGPVREKSTVTAASINQILEFLEAAKSDTSFQALLSSVQKLRSRKREKLPKPAPVEIPPNLTNHQIRELLKRELSKAELAQIAKQRSISSTKESKEKLRETILSFIERQESYDQLRG